MIKVHFIIISERICYSLGSKAFIMCTKEEGKDQESIQSSTTPDPGHHRESDKNTRKHHVQ